MPGASSSAARTWTSSRGRACMRRCGSCSSRSAWKNCAKPRRCRSPHRRKRAPDMCLIAVAWRAHPRYRLALIGNRDEFHGRPTAPAGPDPVHAVVFGVLAVAHWGSWLLASTRGRLAAVTNVRVGRDPEVAPLSRGTLVRGFATGDLSADAYIASLAPDAPRFGRYNLLCWDGDALAFATNHPAHASH